MPPIGPIKRKDLIYFLRQVGFDGPSRIGMSMFPLAKAVHTNICGRRLYPFTRAGARHCPYGDLP
jgi:hypothetical protein